MHKSKGKLSGVLHKGFKPDKCKTALRMAVARIKLLRNRKEVQVRQMRREVAQLLDANQDQTARIRVEHVIREEKFMQAYDLIEVYCELIVARLSIIDSQKTCPIDLKEAIASVIFASMSCSDVTELADVRKHFTSKYGKEFAAAALEVRPDSGVNRLVIEKLSAGAPDTQTKIKTLTSIAEEHNIKWEPKAFEEKLQKQNEDLLHGTTTYSGGNIPSSVMPTSQSAAPSYSYADSANSHIPTAPSYSSAEVPDNRAPYVAASPNAFSQENRGGSEYSVPPSSQHGASAYSSAQIRGPNSISNENTGGPNVSRPYSQYGATVPDTASRSEEFNKPRERKSSVSGSNWNVEFKDATSAAQAAAESAEMASIAARAAAQLASRGNFSAEQNTGAFESAAYTHETTPRKPQAEHLMKDGQRSFSEQNSGANDPRFISSNATKDGERAETNRVDSVNMSAPYSSAQFHSYSPDIHTDEYGMPTESHHARSPLPPYSDDSSEKESNYGRPEDHAFNLPGERLSDARLGGHNIEDTESKHASFDLENTDNYYRNFISSHGTFTHGGSTIWDNQNDKTGANSSAVVFDQYDSDVEEENLLDHFSSKHTEEPTAQDHMGFSNADWGQQHRSESPVNHSTSTLFSRAETHPSYNLEADRKDIPSPHSNDNVAPTFDSDGVSSDEEVTTAMHVKSLRSHSRGSGFSEGKEDIISGKVVHDVNDSSPRSDYSGADGNLGRIKSRDYDLSEEERVPHKLDGGSSGIAGANKTELFSLGRQSPATSTDYDEGDLGLNFGRLTPGLRNKLRQPPPYTKDSGDNMLPKQLVHKTPAIIEKSVHSEENNTLFENTRNTSAGTAAPRSSLGADYNSELYGQHQSVEARVEARSTMRRNYFEPGGDRGKLSEQSSNAPSSMMNKSSVGVNSSQELYHEKPGVGAHRETRTKTAKSYFDSDSEDELEQREKGQTKWSTEQTQSRRTREVTSDTKRETRVQIGVQHAGETESMPKEARSPTGSFSKFTGHRREAPVYSRVPAPRTSPRPVRLDPPSRREKPQEADLNTISVTGKEEDTESTAETPKESTPKTTPAHVHPKLPTDYDSFAAHFRSLRTNRR